MTGFSLLPCLEALATGEAWRFPQQSPVISRTALWAGASNFLGEKRICVTCAADYFSWATLDG